MKFVLGYSHRAVASPAIPLILEGTNDLVQEGFLDLDQLNLPVKANDSLVHAKGPDGDIVGVLAWRPMVMVPYSLYVSLGYVEPSSRHQGCMGLMWDDMLNCQQIPVKEVFLFVHKSNRAGVGVVEHLRVHRTVPITVIEAQACPR